VLASQQLSSVFTLNKARLLNWEVVSQRKVKQNTDRIGSSRKGQNPLFTLLPGRALHSLKLIASLSRQQLQFPMVWQGALSHFLIWLTPTHYADLGGPG
jgi:hypothetical protein